MKDKLLFLFCGIVIGWLTIPLLHADQSPDLKGGPIILLRKMLVVVEQLQITSQQIAANTLETADNTRAIKEKLGVK